MNAIKSFFILSSLGLCLTAIVGCQGKSARQDAPQTTLTDKSLPEIKKLIDGKWELINGQNETQLCEFENTFITFNGDKYIWTEDGNDEPGDLNWRKTDMGAGYDAYLMDAFYATNPAYPLSIKGDTLYLQDCSETGYKYKLVRK